MAIGGLFPAGMCRSNVSMATLISSALGQCEGEQCIRRLTCEPYMGVISSSHGVHAGAPSTRLLCCRGGSSVVWELLWAVSGRGRVRLQASRALYSNTAKVRTRCAGCGLAC